MTSEIAKLAWNTIGKKKEYTKETKMQENCAFQQFWHFFVCDKRRVVTKTNLPTVDEKTVKFKQKVKGMQPILKYLTQKKCVKKKAGWKI